MTTKTYLPKPNEIERKCFLVDAQGKILGRLATRVATILMGKDEVFYTPHMECGDQVIVINAKGIRVTGRKVKEKIYQHLRAIRAEGTSPLLSKFKRRNRN